nr:accessory protein [Drosophila busckii rhabdovirus]
MENQGRSREDGIGEGNPPVVDLSDEAATQLLKNARGFDEYFARTGVVPEIPNAFQLEWGKIVKRKPNLTISDEDRALIQPCVKTHPVTPATKGPLNPRETSKQGPPGPYSQ